MSDHDTMVEALLMRARAGDTSAAGQLLERHRPYLRLLALRQLDDRLDARLDASDLIQQTCLSALRRLEDFRGTTAAEFIVWLKQIHVRNVLDAIRDHRHTAARAVDRERALESDQWKNLPGSRSSAVRASRRAMLDENAVRLAAAMEQLPESQREAVRLRYLEGWSLAEIAIRMERSHQAVAGLLKRGIAGLKRRFGNDPLLE